MFTGINFCFKLIISHYTSQKIKEKKFQTKDKIETQHSFHPTGRPLLLHNVGFTLKRSVVAMPPSVCYLS